MIRLDEEIKQDEHGSFQTYTIDGEEGSHKLYHELVTRRLDHETFDEFKVRRMFAKAYIKQAKKGNFIWFSTNAETKRQFTMLRMAYNASKRKEDEDENKDEANKERSNKFFELTQKAHKEALQTNMGPLNLKKVKERLDEEGKEE